MWIWLFAGVLAASHPDISAFVSGPPNTWQRVKPVRGPTEYFLTASEDIRPGDVVARLPLALAVASFDAFPLLALFVDDSEENKVIARMLYERFYGADGTFAKRWIDTFPANLTNLFLWTDADLQLVRQYDAFGLWDDKVNVSAGYANFARRMRAVQSQYPQMTGRDVFLWGQAQVYRRCFSLTKADWKQARKLHTLVGDDEVEGMACYPLVDLAGFCRLETPAYQQSLSIVVDSISASLVLKSEFAFKASERFCMSVGEYNTFQLMLYQGLAFPYNPYDTLRLGLPRADFGCNGEIQGENCQFTLKTNKISAELISQLRSSRAQKAIPILPESQLLSYCLSAPLPAQTELISSLLSYRSLLLQTLFQIPQHSLRSTFRLLSNATEERERLALTFAVSVWAGPYVQLGKLERVLLKGLYRSLKL